jgi:tetratricopeptide (TPR) repeat protein
MKIDLFASKAAKLLRELKTENAKAAETAALLELAHAPDSRSAWQVLGNVYLLQMEFAQAADALARALDNLKPNATLLVSLAKALSLTGQPKLAELRLQEALAACAAHSHYFELSLEADRQGLAAIALLAIERALAGAKSNGLYALQHARVLQTLGLGAQAAQVYRGVINDASLGNSLKHRAWFGLVDLKTEALSAMEIEQLERSFRAAHDPESKKLLGFALGKALEDAKRFPEAFQVLTQANEAAAAQNPWNAAVFEQFADASVSRLHSVQNANRASGGEALIFIVGLPRSGTTLVEQILAAHSQVEGAGELPFLPMLIQAESQRTGKPYVEWAAQASSQDWQRLASIYLQQTSRYRTQRPLSTDKLPENWHYLGAIRNMFPQARVLDCRRDGLETAWSCYKQLFAPGRVGFSYRVEDLARYWQTYLRCMDEWQQHWAQVKSVDYEALVRNPNEQIPKLIAALGLPWQISCLAPHLASRSVNTPSSSQVRKPIRASSARAIDYDDTFSVYWRNNLVKLL